MPSSKAFASAERERRDSRSGNATPSGDCARRQPRDPRRRRLHRASLRALGPALGYDIYSEPIRHAALDRAMASRRRRPRRSAWCRKTASVGVLLLHPAYPRNSTPGQEKSLLGFAVGVIKVDELVSIATRSAMVDGLVLQIEDPGHRRKNCPPSFAKGHAADRFRLRLANRAAHGGIASGACRSCRRRASSANSGTGRRLPSASAGC